MGVFDVDLSDSFLSDDTASVGGTQVHRSDFAYVGDPNDKSTWKLPMHDESHVRNALARFNQVDIPADRKEEVARKMVREAKKYGIDTSGFEESYLCERESRRVEEQVCPSKARHVAVLLNGPGRIVGRDGAHPGESERPSPLHEIPVAVTGTWMKGERKFSITQQDLANMARNFQKRKNEQVVIDYEHASEMPEVARGGPVIAAGWIHELSVVGANGKRALAAAPLPTMYALVEWTPDAEAMIRKGQYRFFSPAIDWSAQDKETGEAQGATLTSGALTNHPFLEELPPIVLSDLALVGPEKSAVGAHGDPLQPSLGHPLRQGGEGRGGGDRQSKILNQEMAGIHQDGFFETRPPGGAGKKAVTGRGAPSAPAAGGQSPQSGGAEPPQRKGGVLPDATQTMAPDRQGPGQGGNKVVNKLSFQKLTSGKRKVFDDAGVELGEFDLEELDLDDGEFEELATARGFARKQMDETLSELLTEAGLDPRAGAQGLAPLLKPARELGIEGLQSARRAAALSECVKDGAINLDLAADLADEQRIGFSDYRQVQKAHDLVEKSIAEGKFAPADREFISRLALSDVEKFKQWMEKKPRAVPLGPPTGLNAPVAGGTPDQELALRATQLMSEKQLTYRQAAEEIAKTEPGLARRYRQSSGRTN